MCLFSQRQLHRHTDSPAERSAQNNSGREMGDIPCHIFATASQKPRKYPKLSSEGTLPKIDASWPQLIYYMGFALSNRTPKIVKKTAI